jgi:hypothetical protein
MGGWGGERSGVEECYNGREQMHVNGLGLARGHGEAGQALAAVWSCGLSSSLFFYPILLHACRGINYQKFPLKPRLDGALFEFFF